MDNKDIIVAVTGTVTITTEEYVELVKSKVILDGIFAYQDTEQSYRLSEYVKTARKLLEPVITAPESKSEEGDDA